MSPAKKPQKKPKPAPAEKVEKKPEGKSGAKSGGKGWLKDYFEGTRLPVHSLVFVLPMALFYEAGFIIANQPIVAAYGKSYRITADKLIRNAAAQLLELVGVRGAVADPLYYGIMSGVVVMLVLLGWQIVSRKTWQVKPATLLGMLGESALIGLAWMLITKFVMGPLLRLTIEEEPASWMHGAAFGDTVFAVGAGVYEEFLFRLVLVWLFALIVAGITGLEWDGSTIVAVILSAIAFAAHHHLTGGFTWPAFLTRTIAGGFFGAIYYLRGFGVAVGGHVMYDIYCVFIVGEHIMPGETG